MDNNKTNVEKEAILNKAKELLAKIQAKVNAKKANNAQNVENVHEIKHEEEATQQNVVENVEKNNSNKENYKPIFNANSSMNEIDQLEVAINKNLNARNYSFISNRLKRNKLVCKEQLKDIAVIQCFYGESFERIEATVRAIKVNLDSNPLPKDYIFVEAQKHPNNAVFKFLKKFGVKYQFIKIPEQSEGLFIKTALWNIGATMTDASKLCFVDSDVAFCNEDWIRKADDAFEENDVLSLSRKVYYENNPTRKELIRTIGYRIANNTYRNNAHIGFNIGMTRHAYEDVYKRFEAFNMHDDSWIWSKIIGTNIRKELLGWMPYATPDYMNGGLPLKIGYADSICCHLDHGYSNENKYVGYGYISYIGTDEPFQDIDYDNKNPMILPVWKDNNEAKTIRKCFKELDELDLDEKIKDNEIEEIYAKNAIETYGKIDDENPLIIVTIYIEDFLHKNAEIVLNHKKMIEDNCQVPFTYICFSNIKIEGVDTIPYKINEKYCKNDYVKELLLRKDIIYPSNSTVCYIDIDAKISKPFTMFRSNNYEKKLESTNKYGLKNIICFNSGVVAAKKQKEPKKLERKETKLKKKRSKKQ